MSLLYKDPKDVKTGLEVKMYMDGSLNLKFFNSGGKHGTDEILDIFNMTTDTLLEVLTKHFES